MATDEPEQGQGTDGTEREAGVSEEKGEQVDREKRQLTSIDFGLMNVPREFWRVKVQTIQDPKARRAVVRYLKKLDDMFRRGVGLLLCGPAGVGKTSAAIVVGKVARSYGFTVFFTSVWEIRESIKARMNFDDEHTFLDKARDCEFLVLDNVKPEERKEPFYSMKDLEDLVTYRCSQSRPTFITTRVRFDRLDEDLPGVLDAGTGKILPVELKGKDLREQNQDDLISELLGEDDGS